MNNNSNMLDTEVDEVVSIKRYICFYLINCLPIIGFVWCIVKAFDTNENKSYRNLCKSYLLMMVIGIAIVVVLWVVIILLALLISIAF